MGFRYTLSAFILLNISSLAVAQVNFAGPLKGALNLSGAYGEIRTDHLHTGIDYRTGGKIGLKVYAIDKGYISRIKFSPNGYGKAVYITHPNGTTSVYAHLDMLAEPFASFVKDYQYSKQSFAVDMALRPKDLPVAHGQLIAWSGNSGSSGGPHLHFEIRNTKTQHTLNPNFYGFLATDNLKPEIRTIAIYRADSTTLINGKAQNIIRNVKLPLRPAADTIRVSGSVGFGIEAYDWLTPQSTRTGIYSAMYTLNADTVFRFKADSLSFSQGRYVNSLTDYGLRQQTGKRVVKLFIEPNNKLMGYYVSPKTQQGYLAILPDSIYNIKLIAADATGLFAAIDLVIKGEKQAKGPFVPATAPANHHFIAFNKSFSVTTNSVSIHIPKDAFYTNTYFSYSIAESSEKEAIGPTYIIGSPNIPLHKPYSLELSLKDSKGINLKKVCIARVDKDGKQKYMGGIYQNGYVKTTLRTFGAFTIATDTIPPVVVPLKRTVNGKTTLRFRVYDNFSDIAKVNGYINGTWALFEYDPKNELVLYELDKERVTPEGVHHIKLIAEDGLGNISTFESTFSF
ncbi:MAG: M23 family metallopeptidase [Bacteroidales bacterium]|nr:M23 family metallopeptidase [Bacteroidales bacterium]MBN2748619.1 M23 family metallopeptidase [Bacteroidales bacterium]